MKKIVLVALGLLAMQSQAQAHGGGCCTLSGSYLGIMPQFHKNYVGLRYNTRSYSMPPMLMNHSGVLMEHGPGTTDRFTSVEAWGRFYPTRRIQLMGILPYVINESVAGQESVNTKGIGDATLIVSYAIAATPDTALCRVKHRLQLGGGIKLPTGNHKLVNNEGINVPANFAPGSGTLDYLATLQYTVRLNQVGFSTDATYKINNTNRGGYRFGNQVTASGQLFYWQKLRDFSLLPSAGVYVDHSAGDEQNQVLQPNTKATTPYSSFGLDVYYKNLALGGNWQRPFSRTEAHTTMTKSDRAMVHVTVMF